MTIRNSARSPKAARRSRDLPLRPGDLIGKSALVATHAALTLARDAVANADTAVRKYLPVGVSSARAARKAEKARLTVKRKGRKAARKARRAVKSAVKSAKRRTTKRGGR